MKWISVNDEMPPEDEFILMYDWEDEDVYYGMYYEESFITSANHPLMFVSHWRRLPRKPC